MKELIYVLRYCPDKERQGYGFGKVSFGACINCPYAEIKSLGNLFREHALFCSKTNEMHTVKIKEKK